MITVQSASLGGKRVLNRSARAVIVSDGIHADVRGDGGSVGHEEPRVAEDLVIDVDYTCLGPGGNRAATQDVRCGRRVSEAFENVVVSAAANVLG